MSDGTVTTPFVRPDLSRLSKAERREIQRHCTGKLMTDWRTWALMAAFAVPAAVLSMLAGQLFRPGGIWVGMAGGAVGGLVMGAVLGRVIERLTRLHLAAELARRGLCRRCAYDLRGAPGACPECGEAAPPRVSN